MCGVQAPPSAAAVVVKIQDLHKELNKLISNPSSNCKSRIIEFSNYLFTKFLNRMDLIMKLGFDLIFDDVVLLFKSCILVLAHPQIKTSFLLEKCDALINVLTQICSYDGRNKSQTQSSFILSLIEVFIKESITNSDLNRYIHLIQGNLNIIHQLFSTHFILSYPNSKNFIESLSINTFNIGKEIQNEFGLDLILDLLNSKSSFQIPFLLKAHIAVIGSGYFEDRDPIYSPFSDEMVLNRAINAFESSIDLYFQCLPSIGCKSQLGFEKVNYNEKLDCYMDEMIMYCRKDSEEILQSVFLHNFFCYIEEAEYIVHENSRVQACWSLKRILFALILQSNGENNELDNNIGSKCKISEEIVCLTASLKLMSSSLLQVLDRFRELKNEKKHKHISDILSRFTDSESNEIERKVVFNVVGKGLKRGEKSFGMLCHLINLLMYGLDKKIGFLCKGIVGMIMAVMDLILFEEGSLDSVSLLIEDGNKRSNNTDFNTKEINSEDSFENIQEETSLNSCKYRKSSVRIAREIQKVKKRLFVSHDTWKDNSSSKSKNGGLAFFKCLPEFRKKPSHFDDLVDFIECEDDRDYSIWLSKRHRSMSRLKNTLRNRNRGLGRRR